MIFASGFEVTSDLDRRWDIDVIEGRDGLSLFDHWRDGFKTLHGMSTHGFPNLFFTGFIQSALNASTTEQMNRHGYHVAYIIQQALARGATAVEPTQEAQHAWVRDIRATAVDISQFQRECTPSYFNGEGSQKPRWYAGETYGPGWVAFENLLQAWRDRGDLPGMAMTP
jgi:cyclohexanone monooxygenase